jgi:hypothetical protein
LGVEVSEIGEGLGVQLVQVPYYAEADDENQDGGEGVSAWLLYYLRISARTAGECLKPILLP